MAGAAALLVAKAHKLGERLETPRRLLAKDAGDVYRLFDATPTADMSEQLDRLLADDRSASTTEMALDYLQRLFTTPRSPGVQLANNALAGAADEVTVVTVMTGYARDLLDRRQLLAPARSIGTPTPDPRARFSR